MPTQDIPKYALNTALRISAACRHYSQSSMRGRKWIPEDLNNQAKLKRTKTKSADPSASPSEEDEEPADEHADEIEELLRASSKDADWPSEFLKSISGEFVDCSFMDSDNEFSGGR